jgi:hypothetical protein
MKNVQRALYAIVTLFLVYVAACRFPDVVASGSEWFSVLNDHIAAGFDWESGVFVRKALVNFLSNLAVVVCVGRVAYAYGKRVCI